MWRELGGDLWRRAMTCPEADSVFREHALDKANRNEEKNLDCGGSQNLGHVPASLVHKGVQFIRLLDLILILKHCPMGVVARIFRYVLCVSRSGNSNGGAAMT